jgi:arsenate reductase
VLQASISDLGVGSMRSEVSMKRYVFACVHNAGRSQMAAAWLTALADPALGEAISAGTEPAPQIHPEVIEAMREVGIDISDRRPRLLTEEVVRGATMLITMGCGERCPVFLGIRREDWTLPDPKGRPLEEVRAIRDAIRAKVEDLVRREQIGRRRRGG